MNEPASQLMPPPVNPSPRSRPLGWFWWGLRFVVFVLVVIALYLLFGSGPLAQTKTVVVPYGASSREAANLLTKEGVVYHPIFFRLADKFLADDTIKAGEYQFVIGQSLADVVKMVHEGHSVVRLFKVAEGLTSRDVAHLINGDPTLSGDPVAVPPEGSLLPESYRYIYGDSRASLVARMQKAMQETLAELWEKRDPSVPLTSPEQAVGLASMVEKETAKAAERPRIAGVFINRLRLPMRLQSDPTVVYGIVRAKGSLDRALTHQDLEFSSPYNTYTNDGVPPPICNPGRAALAAALHPEKNDYLYFVADGTGGHAFSRTLAEHNQHVTKWNDIKGK